MLARTRVNTSLANIPNGGTLYHIPHSVALDSFVFANATRAIRAAHKCDVATTLLVAAAISSFLCLHEEI